MFGPFLTFITKGTFHDNPVSAVVLTFLLVQLCFFIGDLNSIAQLAAVLFLLSYGAVNLSCLGLSLVSAPNFRPNFHQFHWITCLLGLCGSFAMIFLISPLFSAVALVLCLSLIIILHYFSPVKTQNWGHISQALIFHQVKVDKCLNQ